MGHYIIKKQFDFPTGHRLKKHTGRCANFHGHNFMVEVQLRSESLNNNDMIIDFTDLKNMVGSILDQFDHATVLNPTDKENVDHIEKMGYRTIHISPEGQDKDPTAEVLSRYLYDEIQILLDPLFIIVDAIYIWENNRSMAGYVR